MQGQIQTNHLSLLLFTLLVDFANALPQAVQGRPAVVVDRDQSYVSSTMSWVQKNLFITLVCSGMYHVMGDCLRYNTDVSVIGLGVLIWFIVWYRRRNKTKGIDKTKIAEDRRRTAEDVEAADDLKGRQTAMAIFIKAIGNPFGGRQRV
jgi:hypothetical protein